MTPPQITEIENAIAFLAAAMNLPFTTRLYAGPNVCQSHVLVDTCV